MKLSFCIPTYNRKSCLEETLTSIMSQYVEGIEIVVSDNHSLDGTHEWMQEITCPSLLYHRWPHSVPCGENLLKTVALARGEYCWLMTDDDRVEPGGVQHVLQLLQQHQHLTGISVNVEGYDRTLKHKKTIRYSHCLRQDHLFTEAEEAFKQLSAWWGFWSAQIVHRKQWHAAAEQGDHAPFVGYHHRSIMIDMIHKAPRWLFTYTKCVGYRSNNESFSQEYGRLRRFEIDAFSYTTLGKQFFTRDSVRQVNHLVLRKLLFWQLVAVKGEQPSLHLLKALVKVAFRYYKSYPQFWYKILPLLCIPSAWLHVLRYGYRIYRRWV